MKSPSRFSIARTARRLSSWLLAAFFLFGHVDAAEVALPEYEVKAAFLFNFARFVEHAQKDPESSTRPIVIHVVGASRVVRTIQHALSGTTLEQRPLQVKPFESALALSPGDILFISVSQEKSIPHFLNAVRGRSILTVSESRRFIPQGGMVNFFMEQNRVRFAVNLDAIRKANLSLSSQMLQYAQIVE